MENPNHSNARYMKGSEAQVKSAAFRSKGGYSEKNYSKKLKDQMNGMPMPGHMKKDCP